MAKFTEITLTKEELTKQQNTDICFGFLAGIVVSVCLSAFIFVQLNNNWKDFCAKEKVAEYQVEKNTGKVEWVWLGREKQKKKRKNERKVGD